MKNLIKMAAVAGAYTLIATSISAKTINAANVPQEVVKQFGNQYPTAKSTKWSAENGNYQVVFKENGAKTVSTYNSSGEWQKSVSVMKKLNLLPSQVQAGLKKSSFKNYCVDKIEQVSTPAGNRYILNVDNHNGNWGITEGFGGVDDEQLKFTEGGLLIGVKDISGPDEDDI